LYKGQRGVNNSALSKNQGIAILDKARFSEVLLRVLENGRRKIVTLQRMIQTDFYKYTQIRI
jgi:hypothetical protein